MLQIYKKDVEVKQKTKEKQKKKKSVHVNRDRKPVLWIEKLPVNLTVNKPNLIRFYWWKP